MIETFVGVPTDCAAAPVTVTEWRTMWVSGNGYAADGVRYLIQSDMTVAYTYHDLFLTLLNPGDVMTQVHTS